MNFSKIKQNQLLYKTSHKENVFFVVEEHMQWKMNEATRNNKYTERFWRNWSTKGTSTKLYQWIVDCKLNKWFVLPALYVVWCLSLVAPQKFETWAFPDVII